MFSMPAVTRNLLIINFLAFIICLVVGPDATGEYVLNNTLGLHFFMASDFHLYQLVTYMFMHAGWEHIIFNMFALWMFGCVVERVWGGKKFLFYYISCGIGAGLFQEGAQYIQYLAENLASYNFVTVGDMRLTMDEYLNEWTTVGASGAIYAILLAFGMLFPNERLFIIPIPIPIKAKYFVIGYAVIELVSALFTPGDNVAHIAHLGGMVFGFFMIRYWRNHPTDGYSQISGQQTFDKIKNLFGGRNRSNVGTPFGNRNSSSRNNPYESDWDYNARKRANQEEIDRILDKIRKSGYDSLTREEKQKLFDQSNNK